MQPRLLQPQAVGEAVEHPEARGLADLFGGEQLVPAMGGHRLVGLDLAEAGVLVAQIAETGDQHPLQGSLALPVGDRRLTPNLPGPGLQLLPEGQDGPQGPGHQTLALATEMIARLRNELVEGRGSNAPPPSPKPPPNPL